MKKNNRTIRITHIIKNANIGGVQKFVSSLLPLETEGQYGYNVILYKEDKGPLLKVFRNKRIQYSSPLPQLKPFRPYRWYLWLKKNMHNINYLALTIFFSLKRPYLLHSHFDNLTDVSTQLAVCRTLHIPFIWTIHGVIFNTDLGYSRLKHSLSLAIKSKLPMAIIYVGQKPPILDSLELPEEIKVEHIPSGIDLAIYYGRKGTKKDIRAIYGYSNEEILIGYIGRLSHEKGVDILLEALELIAKKGKQYRLIIIGEGFEEQSLRSQVQLSALEAYVNFIGPSEVISQILPMLDVCVLPSRSEGLPLIMLEAMASQIPVIATCVGGIPRVISHNVNGILVAKESPDELTTAIISVIENESLRERITAEAYKKVQEFDINLIRQKYLEIYQGILG